MLDYRVFTTKRPGLNREIPPGYEPLMYVVNSATLIHGEHDAVLVDTFLTTEQSAGLADAIAATGKRLTHIYVTHGHGDHFFGLNVLFERFPDARAVATSAVVERMREQVSPEILDGFWGRLFPGQLPAAPAIAESLEGEPIDLEGELLVPVETGYTDTADSTSLHVPSIGLIAAGDVVYNEIHPYQAETTERTRHEWISALDRLAALEPRAVVAGHKKPESPDDPRHIAETRRYLADFIRLDHETDTVIELFDAMIERYPDRANPGSLWGAAKRAKEPVAVSPEA
jgi:glyoxylase-like metal-dependent hydrolase (beta-lactamase superfamily II)